MKTSEEKIEEFRKIWLKRIDQVKKSVMTQEQCSIIWDKYIQDYIELINEVDSAAIEDNPDIFRYMSCDLGIATKQAENNRKQKNKELLVEIVKSIAGMFSFSREK